MRNPMYAVAVIAVVAVGGLAALYAFGPGLNLGGPGPVASTTPSTPEPTPEPTPAATCLPSVAWEPCPVLTQSPAPENLLPQGPYALVDGEVVDNAPAMMVTIPAPDWHQWEPGTIVKNNDPLRPDGAGIVVFSWGLVLPFDSCDPGVLHPLATTVDELVAGLAAQETRDATEPVDVTVDGYAGKSITLHLREEWPYDENSGCSASFDVWGTPGDTLGNLESVGGDTFIPIGNRANPFDSKALGQTDKLWILDVDGHLVVIDTVYHEDTPQKVVDEMEAIVGSITFDG